MTGKRNKFLSDIRKMSDKALRARLRDLQVELMKYRTAGEVGQASRMPPHPMHIRNLKKNIARVKTVLRERELSV